MRKSNKGKRRAAKLEGVFHALCLDLTSMATVYGEMMKFLVPVKYRDVNDPNLVDVAGNRAYFKAMMEGFLGIGAAQVSGNSEYKGAIKTFIRTATDRTPGRCSTRRLRLKAVSDYVRRGVRKQHPKDCGFQTDILDFTSFVRTRYLK